MTPAPTLRDIETARDRIADHVVRTPTHRLREPAAEELIGAGELHLKLEFLQRTGTFKARGAINNLRTLSPDEARRGVVAVSAGNHAIAVSYASQAVGVSAKVVMSRAADPYRVEACRRYGAEVILADDIAGAFATMDAIREEEHRIPIHPFDGRRTLAGTGTVGLEIAEQVPGPDVVIVAVGGGGLVAGVGSALRALHPSCRVVGVEPAGAAGLSASLRDGRPVQRVDVDTIADSMGAPTHTQATFDVCREVVDDMVTVDDDAMCRAMAYAYDVTKFALEPAGAAALAAAFGPLRDELVDQRTVAILCGSNIGEELFARYVGRGRGSG